MNFINEKNGFLFLIVEKIIHDGKKQFFSHIDTLFSIYIILIIIKSQLESPQLRHQQ